MTGLNPATLAREKNAVVVDDRQATMLGKWTDGQGLKGYVSYGYRYANPNSDATARFELPAPATGDYDVLLAWQPHGNRGTLVPVTIEAGTTRDDLRVNMRKPSRADGFGLAGRVRLTKGDVCAVTLGTDGAGGLVHADAVMLVPVEEQ